MAPGRKVTAVETVTGSGFRVCFEGWADGGRVVVVLVASLGLTSSPSFCRECHPDTQEELPTWPLLPQNLTDLVGWPDARELGGAGSWPPGSTGCGRWDPVCPAQPQLRGCQAQLFAYSELATVHSRFIGEAGPQLQADPSPPEASWRRRQPPQDTSIRALFPGPPLLLHSPAQSGPWLAVPGSSLVALHPPCPLPSTPLRAGKYDNTTVVWNPHPTFLYLANPSSSITPNVKVPFSRRFSPPPRGWVLLLAPTAPRAQSSLFHAHCITGTRQILQECPPAPTVHGRHH